MESIQQDKDTSLKKTIEIKFMYVCEDVTELRSIIMNRTPGNVDTVFSTFRKDFDSFFTMSSDNTKINKDLVEEINTWLNEQLGDLTLGTAKKGIRLFTEYKAELFKQGIIKY